MRERRAFVLGSEICVRVELQHRDALVTPLGVGEYGRPGHTVLPAHHDHEAAVVVLPVPYEATVSYMPGTRFGPRGLLHASRYVELYDHELDLEPYRVGVFTLPELMLSGAGPEAALAELRTAFDALLGDGRFVIMVGGEHSVSGPPILAHAERSDERISVLQLDAHADLRTE